MNVTIHLNWQYDLDLIALKKHPDFEFGKWAKKAVIAWARQDEDFFIPLPERPISFSTELTNTTAHFRLSSTEEDVLKVVLGIRYGFRGSLVKNIIRHYLPTPYIAPYYNTETYRVKVRGRERISTLSSENKPIEVPKKTIPDYLKIPNRQNETKPSKPVLTQAEFAKETFLSENVAKLSNESAVVFNEYRESKPNIEPSHTSTDNAQEYAFDPDNSENDGFDFFSAVGSMMGN